MKNLACLSFLSTLSFASLAVLAGGCGSGESSDPFGPEPDYASMQQRFTAPSGTIDERNMSAVFSRYSEQQGAGSMANVGVGTSTTVTSEEAPAPVGNVQTKALHVLGGTGLTASCSALKAGNTTGSCACPDGGSFAYDFSGLTAIQQSTGPIDASLKVRFDGCRAKDVAIDGREFVRVHADRGGSKSIDLKSFSMLLVADLDVSKAGVTHSIDLVAILRDGELEIALQVDDGWVTVRATGSATTGFSSFVVRDRNGSWTCDVNNGSGTCHDDKGNTRKF